jgi:16S rRNA (adenine1518-N6/adenine1519-N6)-dimethyltransferase
VLVSIVRRRPPVAVDEQALWRTIEVAFAQRRKTMRSALLRLGLDPDEARRTLDACGISPLERPERLDVHQFACLAERWRRATR